MSRTAKIKFVDGTEAGLINRWSVYTVRKKYLKMDCVIYADGERIPVPLLSQCETCRREYSDIRSQDKHLCPKLHISKQLGHVARICIDCIWYFEQEKGIDPPPSIGRFIAEGFRPHLI